ncbi:hypothetical protein V7S43_005125 [Phytophthora oleae]|uniref:Uncharacterized protein n=1 Tax=Phytophthora oleae TaxID=2107226 RepID=A0ABD3FVW7_9STRA
MRPSFPSSGYAVISLQLDTSTLDALYAEALFRTYTPVFQEVGGADDPFRFQSRATKLTAVLRVVSRAVQEDAAIRDCTYKPTVFSYMRSLPGGVNQEPHQDYVACVSD